MIIQGKQLVFLDYSQPHEIGKRHGPIYSQVPFFVINDSKC